MQNEKIIQVIAEYLERNTLITSVSGENPFECRYQFAAEQIAAAIAPHLEAGAGTTPEQLREQFEATGYTSWINSEIYPDGRIYTKEYTEWLERKVLLVEPKDFPYSELFDHMANEHGLTLTNTELGDIIHIARGEGTKTAWEDAPSWAGWRIEYSDGSHNFSKGYPSIITDGVIKVECRPK